MQAVRFAQAGVGRLKHLQSRSLGLKLRRGALVLVTSAALLGGCRQLSHRTSTLPVRHQSVHGQLIIYRDFDLPQQHRLIEELVALRGDLAVRLKLPTSDEPIHVYLFESDERFHQFIRAYYPDFPVRRAFFVEGDTRLGIYAHWGDRVAEDLRHEVAHGYIHSVLPNVPLWLDEGFAEYFEVPRGQQGRNQPHLDELTARYVDGSWRPHLERLEDFRSAAEMDQTDYAEAWAWVHLLLETTPERRDLLHRFLHELRQNGTTEPLSSFIRRSMHQPEVTLVQHLWQTAEE